MLQGMTVSQPAKKKGVHCRVGALTWCALVFASSVYKGVVKVCICDGVKEINKAGIEWRGPPVRS